MPARETMTRETFPDRDALERQVRQLEERLAFYEGFDQLIQDNVAHARELFRLAARERESAAAANDRLRQEAERYEAESRAELEAVASELEALARAVDALSRRVARALRAGSSGGVLAGRSDLPQPVAVVVHGVPSARTALSLQQFVASLPQVEEVSPREFAGGMLRLDARVRDALAIEQFDRWQADLEIQVLTERADVLEFALGDRVAQPATGR